MSRRAVLGAGAAIAAAAATATAVGLRRSRDGSSPAPRQAGPPTSAVATPTATPVAAPRGGIARIHAFSRFNFDGFDPLLARERSVLEVLGRTHSRLLEWSDYEASLLGPDLAASWELPDAQTLVLHLDRTARWHGGRGGDGGPVTGEDVSNHFNRLLQARTAGALSDSLARGFARLDGARAVGGVVTLTAARADPLLLAALAGSFAIVPGPGDAPGPSDSPEGLRGSGAFVLESTEGGLRFIGTADGHRQALLEGLIVDEPPGDGPVARERFVSRQLDQFLARDRRDVSALQGAGAVASRRYEDSPTMSTFFMGAPPWNNVELVSAISGALNRPELARRLHAGQAAASGPVAPAFGAFALPESELVGFAGYRFEFERDAADARARWMAAGGPGLGAVTIDFPSIYDPLYSASSTVIAMLNEVLGPQFKPAIQNYTSISAKAAGGRYGGGEAATWFGWGPAMEEPDPSRWLVSNFRSGSSGWKAFGLRLPAVDRILDSLSAEFSITERQTLAQEAARELLRVGGGGMVPWLLQQATVFRWAYFGGPGEGPFPRQHLDRHYFLDQTASGYGVRPSRQVS